MKNTKLIQLLSAFSKNEMKQCLLWLKSPIHNDSKILITLFEEISNHYPDFDAEKIDAEKLFLKLYPEKEYADDLMRKNSSNLYEQCLAFITWQQFNQHTNEKRKSLFAALLQKHQYKDLVYEINDTEKKITKEKISIENIQFNVDISHFKYKAIYSATEKKGKQGSEEKNELYSNNIQAKIDSYFIDFTSSYLVYLSFAKVYDFNIAAPKKDFIDALYKQSNQENSLIHIYYNLYLLQTDYNIKNLDIIFNLLDKSHQDIAPKNLHNILNILINTINDNFNLDSIEVERQRLRVYKIMSEPSVLLANNPVLNSILYSNIIYTYINLKEFELAMNFIDNNTKFLDAHLQSSYQKLALARWYFAQKEYGEAQSCLIETENLEPHLRFRARLILVQIYYFISEFDVLFSYIESTTKSLQRDESLFPEKTRKSIFLFLANLEKLAKIKILPTKESAEKLKSKINDLDSFLFKDWIIEELGKLK